MKNLSLITLILLLGSISVMGQNSKWIWGLSLTPEYSISTINDDLVESENQFGLAIQPVIGYTINERIQIMSGVVYDFSQVYMLDFSVLLGCDMNNSGGPDYKNSWIENDVQVHYLGLPVQLKYNFLTKENAGYVRLGYNQLFKIKQSGISTLHQCDSQIEILAYREVRDITGEIELGVGMEIGFGANSNLLLEVVGGYGITGIYDDHATLKNASMFDIGLRVGVLFN